MLPLARKHFEKELKECEVFADESCKYYPCHFESQDCTWCFCSSYPCVDLQESIRLNEKEWTCSICHWIHKTIAAKKILEELKRLDIEKPEELEDEREKITDIKKSLKEKNIRR